MQSFSRACQRSVTIVTLLSLALLLTLPVPAGAQDMMADSVFMSIRVYDGVDPMDMDMDEAIRLAVEGYLPIISASEGFIAYYWLPVDDDTLATISVFNSAEEASASNDAARDYIVEENLVAQLPNRPQIVEGKVHIGFAEMLDGMGDDDIGSLYASVRIYDEFETDELDEFVATVEDGFLPIIRESAGFFGYYLMHDDAGALATISIFDSEASALASNEQARDFVAENLTAYLPTDPSVVSGRVGIAVLADLNEGANLIDDMLPETAFASIRVYEGVNPADHETYVRLLNDGFLPILRQSEGFVGYYQLMVGERHASVSLFETEAQAQASKETARVFIAEHLAPLMPNPPLIVEGLVEVMHLADADEMMMADGTSSLHALLAIYDGFDMARLDEAVDSVESVLIPDLRENGGLFAYYGISDGADTVVALRVMNSEQSLQQGSEIAADFIAEYAADWLPEDPLQVTGPLAVAALANLQMGENLIEEMADTAVFASVRVYDGIDPTDQAEIVRLTDEGFLPIIRESDGFVGYYFLPAEDMLATVSLFASPEQASASNDAARDFIVDNLAPLLPNPPAIFEGQLAMNVVPALLDSYDHDADYALYASIRLYEGFDLAHFDEANDLAMAHLLPTLQDLGGLFAQYAFNDGETTVVGVSVFDSEAAALAANEAGKAFTIEYVADWAPNPPSGVSGKLAIATLAEIDMGENLVGAVMES